MVRAESIIARLQKLEEYIRLLERLREYPKSALLEDPLVYGNWETNTHCLRNEW